MIDIRAALRTAGFTDSDIDRVLAALPAPDAADWQPDPNYFRELVTASGLSQRALARRLQLRKETVRGYMKGALECPYSVQYCLEVLAAISAENDHLPQSELDHDR